MTHIVKRYLRRLFCSHGGDLEFVRNIYGDEINYVSLKTVYRSWWRCRDCGEFVPQRELIP